MQRSRYHVPAVRRAAGILRKLAASGTPIGIGELSRTLHLPKASVFRIVLTLEHDGLLERVDGDRFTIGLAAFEIGNAYRGRAELNAIFRSVAARLVREHNETVQLAVLVGTEVLYLAKEDSSEPVRLVSHLGTRLPASSTSLGKAMLACLPDEEVKALYAGSPPIPLTPKSHKAVETLLDDLRITRARGWAHDNEEASLGLECVGAAIVDEQRRPVAAISIAVPTQRMPDGRLHQLGEAVRQSAREISSLLGYRALDASAT